MSDPNWKRLSFGKLLKSTRMLARGQLREAAELLRGTVFDLVRGTNATSRHGSKGMADSQTSKRVLRGVGQIDNQWARFGVAGGRILDEHKDDQFHWSKFSNTNGKRDFGLFVPTGFAGKRPLVVMLHGCLQSAADFAVGSGMNAVAQQEGVYILYPEQDRIANVQRCWNWYETANQRRNAGESALIAQMTEAVIRDHPIDQDRVYIAGLSAGGAAAVNVARAYPELFAAVGVHSGLAAGCAHDLGSALMAMKVGASGNDRRDADRGGSVSRPTIVFHGDKDGTVALRNADEILTQAGSADFIPSREDGSRPEGRTFTRTRYRDDAGRTRAELWLVHDAGHAWSGGSELGSYTDPKGPDASRAMWDFFAQHRRSNDVPRSSP